MVSLTSSALEQLLDDLATASPARRAELVSEAADRLGTTVRTIYRRLGALGWSSGRRPRSDRGESAVSTDALVQVAAMMAAGRNKRGQPNVPTSEAHRVAREQGLGGGEVSYSQLTRRLRQEGLSMADLRAPEGSIRRITRHPNHAWFFDISVAIQWYFRDESGKKLDQYDDAGARFYPGKIDNFRALRRIIHRYTVTDHYTGAYYVRYYYSSGERAVDVVDFLWRAFAPKTRPEAFPLHGLPEFLVMDLGGANQSAIVQNLLRDVQVKTQAHAKGNPKASGSVESRHNAWQRSFEGRLRLRTATQPVRDLDELNRLAEDWAATAQAERPLTRHGRPPLELWAAGVRARPEVLRGAPDRATFLSLASCNAEEGVLTPELHLRADGRRWYVTGLHVRPGQTVRYRLSPFLDAGVRVWDAHGRELGASEVRMDAVSGQVASGSPVHVFGDEERKGASTPTTMANRVVRQVEELPELHLDDVFGGLTERVERQAFLSAIAEPVRPMAATTPVLGELDALDEVRARLGRRIDPEETAWWKEQMAGGVTAERLDELWLAFQDLDATAEPADLEAAAR